MSDDFEDLLKRWLHEQAVDDRSALRALAGNVAALPPRRPNRRRPLAVAAIAVALGLGALVLAPRLGSVANQPEGPKPPDPAAFAGDARLERCAAELVAVELAFEMTKASYFPLHFPGWWKGAPELEVDDPALVVIEPEHDVAGFGGPAGESLDPDADRGYVVCIAVGTPEGFVVHRYGPTRFDRIVPALSAEDLARAQHMDPDVFADPANYPVPERLAPCGGLIDDVQYVFEVSPGLDLPRHFPAARPAPEMNLADVALVVVFRSQTMVAFPRPSGASPRPSLGSNERDVCVVSLDGDPMTTYFAAVDITGFHVRLDDVPLASTPPPVAVVPSITPSPAPAWTEDAAAALQCDGPPSTFGSGWGQGALGTTEQSSPEGALGEFLRNVRDFYQPFPLERFEVHDRATGAVAFGYFVRGGARAIAVVRSTTSDADGLWYFADVASCDPSEFGPDVELGVEIGMWRDPTGNVVPTTTVHEIADCYDGTKLTVDGRLFVWDPNLGINDIYDPARLDATFADDAELPPGAIDTGYTSGERRLFVSGDGAAAFMVRVDGIQRWPHVTGDSYERTDCN
jgi:hypothetical protein